MMCYGDGCGGGTPNPYYCVKNPKTLVTCLL